MKCTGINFLNRTSASSDCNNLLSCKACNCETILCTILLMFLETFRGWNMRVGRNLTNMPISLKDIFINGVDGSRNRDIETENPLKIRNIQAKKLVVY
jgi:hypothetical protein